jgi:hypothetical protein
MIGLTVFVIVIIFLIFYVWLIVKVAKFVKRKTGSSRLAILSIFVVFALTVGDTIINRLYHKEVLCKRDDVGVKIFSIVEVPTEYWDKENNKPILKELMNKDRVSPDRFKPFLGRYAETEKFENGGLWPLTSYSRHVATVVDTQAGQVLGQFIDYERTGGTWWLFPLGLAGSNSMIGWFTSRGNGSNSCYEHPTDLIVDTNRGVFQNKSKGEQK